MLVYKFRSECTEERLINPQLTGELPYGLYSRYVIINYQKIIIIPLRVKL